MAVMLIWLMEGIYEVVDIGSGGMTRLISNITVITATIWEAVMLVLLFEGIYEVCRWVGFMWRDIHNKVSWSLVQSFKQY
jgi:hypothetical protein